MPPPFTLHFLSSFPSENRIYFTTDDPKNTTIYELKEQYLTRRNNNNQQTANDLEFVYCGKVLDSDRTIASYQITSASSLHVLLSDKGNEKNERNEKEDEPSKIEEEE